MKLLLLSRSLPIFYLSLLVCYKASSPELMMVPCRPATFIRVAKRLQTFDAGADADANANVVAKTKQKRERERERDKERGRSSESERADWGAVIKLD